MRHHPRIGPLVVLTSRLAHAWPPARPPSYSAVYVFRYAHMRNQPFKELREAQSGTCRFFMGANRVLTLALGRSQEDELKENVRHRGGCSGPVCPPFPSMSASPPFPFMLHAGAGMLPRCTLSQRTHDDFLLR